MKYVERQIYYYDYILKKRVSMPFFDMEKNSKKNKKISLKQFTNKLKYVIM